jgi:hypothetical protein
VTPRHQGPSVKPEFNGSQRNTALPGRKRAADGDDQRRQHNCGTQLQKRTTRSRFRLIAPSALSECIWHCLISYERLATLLKLKDRDHCLSNTYETVGHALSIAPTDRNQKGQLTGALEVRELILETYLPGKSPSSLTAPASSMEDIVTGTAPSRLMNATLKFSSRSPRTGSPVASLTLTHRRTVGQSTTAVGAPYRPNRQLRKPVFA